MATRSRKKIKNAKKKRQKAAIDHWNYCRFSLDAVDENGQTVRLAEIYCELKNPPKAKVANPTTKLEILRNELEDLWVKPHFGSTRFKDVLQEIATEAWANRLHQQQEKSHV
jgi:hypothetical protein